MISSDTFVSNAVVKYIAQGPRPQLNMQNWIASLALLTWPLVVLWLYKTLQVGPATVWAFLAANLLLPVHAMIKVEGIPQFDKSSIPALAAIIGCLMIARQRLKWFGRSVLLKFLFLSLSSVH